jgi:ribosome production factor 2
MIYAACLCIYFFQNDKMIRKPTPKTAKGHRVVKAREPVAQEGAKAAVFLRGTTTSSLVSDALKELHALKKPDSVMFSKRNDVHPFDDFKPLEFFSQKNDAAFFILANHSKKKPHNLVFARMFDHQMLDMIELGYILLTRITDIFFMDEFPGSKTALGNRPLMLFHGEKWTTDPYQQVKSMMLDLFSGDTYAVPLT